MNSADGTNCRGWGKLRWESWWVAGAALMLSPTATADTGSSAGGGVGRPGVRAAHRATVGHQRQVRAHRAGPGPRIHPPSARRLREALRLAVDHRLPRSRRDRHGDRGLLRSVHAARRGRLPVGRARHRRRLPPGLAGRALRTARGRRRRVHHDAAERASADLVCGRTADLCHRQVQRRWPGQSAGLPVAGPVRRGRDRRRRLLPGEPDRLRRGRSDADDDHPRHRRRDHPVRRRRRS